MSIATDTIVSNYMHVGSLKNETNPKTRKYHLAIDSGMTILDTDLLQEQLDNARKKIQNAQKENKQVLVVCEKSMYREELSDLAKSKKFHYLNTKLPAGFLTNFNTLIQRIESMNEKKKFVLSDAYQRLTKKEQVMIKRELRKVERIYEGVKGLKKKPDLVVVVDGSLTSGLVDELGHTGIDNIVFASTNFDRRWDHGSLVMMNMQSFRALDTAMKYIFS